MKQQKKRDKKYISLAAKTQQNTPKPVIHVSISCGGVKGVKECKNTGFSDIRAYRSIDTLNTSLNAIKWQLQTIKTKSGMTIFVPICEECVPVLDKLFEKMKEAKSAEKLAETAEMPDVTEVQEVITKPVKKKKMKQVETAINEGEQK